MHTEVEYRGYGPTFNTTYNITYYYSECATDEPISVRRLNIPKMMPFFTDRFHISHIKDLIAMLDFLWLHNHPPCVPLLASVFTVNCQALGYVPTCW